MRGVVVVLMLVYTISFNHALARPSLTGKVVTTVGDVGAHYPLFLVEKSHHPQNITVVYTKLDPNCRVLPDRAHGLLPTLDFYWLMAETSYKPMAGLLKDGARKRLQFTDAHWQQVDPTAFAVRTDDLSHVQHDIPYPTVQIKAARQSNGCVATALMTLGPSNGHATIKLESVYTKTEAMTMLKQMEALQNPDAIRIEAVTVKGTDIATGQPIERIYRAAP